MKKERYFNIADAIIWLGSMALLIVPFFIFDGDSYLSLFASVVGATSLLFFAKGNPIGQVLMIIFCLLYGIISYSFRYYGEMITYLGMTLPMTVVSLVSWLKNPYEGKKSEVSVRRISKWDVVIMLALAAVVTVVFYYILRLLGTSNLLTSTVSVATSFAAAYLTFRRCPYYALAYAVNDVVLVVLWIMATVSEVSYLSVVLCFVTFLANDIYGFVCWKKMQRRQTALQ